MEERVFKIPSKEVQEIVIDRILNRVEARQSSFTREEFVAFGLEAKIPAVFTEQVSQAAIEDIGGRVFSRLLVNGLIIPIKGTKYYRKITQEEMQAAKKAYLAAQKEVNQEAQNGGTTIFN